MPEHSGVSSEQVKQLKRQLEVWREVILPINSVLIWEKPWYPALLSGSSTIFFLLFWYLDPSVLTTLAFIGLVFTIGDYAFYLFGKSGNRTDYNDKWTGKKEKQLDEICQNLTTVYVTGKSYCKKFFLLRQNHTKTYYISTIVCLVALSWLGSAINNLLLTYFIATVLLLLPGMKHHGIIQQWMSSVMTTLSFGGEAAKTSGKKSE